MNAHATVHGGGEHPAIANLRSNQRQLDADGCMVGVSRQALDETLALYDELLARSKAIVTAFCNTEIGRSSDALYYDPLAAIVAKATGEA